MLGEKVTTDQEAEIGPDVGWHLPDSDKRKRVAWVLRGKIRRSG